eukprot:14283194-Alexandrium_andersonii.AAC.1
MASSSDTLFFRIGLMRCCLPFASALDLAGAVDDAPRVLLERLLGSFSPLRSLRACLDSSRWPPDFAEGTIFR